MIMVSDLNDSANPFKRTTTKIDGKGFSPLETHNNVVHFNNETKVRTAERVEESASLDTPLESTPMMSNVNSKEGELNNSDVKLFR